MSWWNSITKSILCSQHCATILSTVLRQLIPIVFSVQPEVQYSRSKHNNLHFPTNTYPPSGWLQNRTVYTELPATGTQLTVQLLNSELRYIHYIGTETEQQNIPIRIRCSQWRVRDTTMWLSRTSAASSTITANRITKQTNRDQVFAVASQRHDNVALHGRSCQLNCHCTCAHTHTHTHTQNMSFWCLFLS